MTTLVYSRKENIIAIDTRCTMDNIVSSNNANKWFKYDDRVYFFCGDLADAEKLARCIEDGIEHLDENEYMECTIVYAGLVPIAYYVDSGVIKHYNLTYADFSAYGSGATWALSAFDHGATAKKAVEHAMSRDPYTGGKVVQYDLSKQRFKK